MEQPLVSAIVPNFNYSSFLEECLDSIIAQDYPNLEVIVVDDGSTDDSLELLKKFESKVTIISQSNQGVSAARNRGILESKGEFIALVDSDDYWEPTKISKQMMELQRTQSDLVYSGVDLVSPDGGEKVGVLRPEYSGDCSEMYRRYPARAIVLLGCSNALFRRSVLGKSGLFDIRLSISADWDFFRRYCDHGKVTYTSESLTNYRVHPANMTTYSDSFVSDTVRCVQKMNHDDKNASFLAKRLPTLLRMYILIIKYRVKNV